MDITKELLEQSLNNMIRARDSYSAELKLAPEGYLTRTSSRGAFTYRQACDINGQRHFTGISRNKPLQYALVRKELVRRSLVLIEGNIAALEACIQKYSEVDPASVIKQLPAVYAGFPLEAYCRSAYGLANLHGDKDIQARIKRHQEWAAEEFEQKAPPEEADCISGEGVVMRSKNELLVAAKLHEFGILYKYEKALNLGGNVVHPDFTVRKKNGQEMYIEVCGMMDDKSYVHNFQRKRDLYERYGIAEWAGNIVFLYFYGNTVDVGNIERKIRDEIAPQV